MADRATYFQISFMAYQFQIVRYGEKGVRGIRKLGPGRYAIDTNSRWSFLFEKYWWP